MFRRSLGECVIALSFTAISAAVTPAAAQTAQTAQAPPCSAPLELVGDLGVTGMKCTGCSIASRRIPGFPDFEFSTEPTLVGITRGGPAEGKLQEYDVLVALNGQLITTRAAAVLYSWPPPGKSLRFTIRRDGTLKDVDVVPTPRCRAIGSSALPSPMASPFSMQAPALPANRGWFGISILGPPLTTYPEITNVVADSPAEKAGLKVGDMLAAMDGRSLKDIEVMTAFRDVKPGQKVLLSIVRDGDWLKVTVVLGPPR